MDPRLLRAYEEELYHLRQTSREFGNEHEGVAGFLGLGAPSDPDPHVERLMEGVAFLSARVKLKLDDQFPDFSQSLLASVQPSYLSPTPSIGVVQLAPNLEDPSLVTGPSVPRETEMKAEAATSDVACRFRTGHAVQLLPLEIEEAEYLGSRAGVSKFAASLNVVAEAGLRLRFRATGGVRLGDIAVKNLPVFLPGMEHLSGELYRQLLGDCIGVVAIKSDKSQVSLPKPSSYGFSDDCALLPHEGRSFRGYRVLTEYFACPERFMFVEFKGLDKAFAECDERCEIVLLFSRSAPLLDRVVTPERLRLFCTPIVNLFELQLDRIRVSPLDHEFQVIPDRSNVLSYEVYRLLTVGVHARDGSQTTAMPIYSFGSQLHDWKDAVFYTTRLRSRRMSTKEQRAKKRSDYVGTEAFLSLTCPGSPQRMESIAELSLRALCTNRELPETYAIMGRNPQFEFEDVPAVTNIELVRPLSRPRPPLGLHEAAWRVVGHLTPNYTSLVRTQGGDPSTLRDHIALYRQADDHSTRRQVDGILSVNSKSISRRVNAFERNAFARGDQIRIRLDDASYESERMFLFTAILDCFLGEFCSVNSFVETVFESPEKGVFATWPVRIGTRPTI
jgi:type VI secretion system VasI/ImpG family protein